MEITSYQLQELLASVKAERLGVTQWVPGQLFLPHGVFNVLLKECVRLVDNYCEDIYYDLQALDNDVKHFSNDSTEFANSVGRYLRPIALRENGVDGEGYITMRINNSSDVRLCYRAIYLIEVIVNDAGLYQMNLYSISRSRLYEKLEVLRKIN